LFFGAENPNYISEQTRPACAGGQVSIPGTRVDEHMIVECGGGSLWMLLRNTGGIAQSVSTDGGQTWSDGSRSCRTTTERRGKAGSYSMNENRRIPTEDGTLFIIYDHQR
jgi:Neuraminidase (sialidase)